MRKKFIVFINIFLALAITALFLFCDLGDQPLGSTIGKDTSTTDDVIDTIQGIRTLRIFSSKTQLKADNTDYAVITAILINENNNPAVGDSIQFFSDLGIIGEYGVTDTMGRTSVTLQSAPINGICTIRAIAPGTLDSATTTVIFSGVSLQLTADPVDLKTGQYSTVQALLTDASNHPIEGDEVTFTVTGGVFMDGSAMKTVTLNTNGVAEVNVTSNTATTVLVHATSLNCSYSTAIHFSNSILTLTASPGIISVGGSASTLRATYRDGNNKLISGAWINFYTNAGELSADSAITVNGVATTYLYSAQFAGVATVQAAAPNGIAETTVEFAAINADSIDLKISPDNISVNGGVAVLTATVIDPQGNMVSGAPVNFKILQGPGGGESIDNPMVISKDGIARASIYAGSLPSQYRACEVSAYIGSTADTSKMTISGEPHIVTVARPQDDTVVVTEAGQIGPSTFKFNIGAVVQDVNGNDIADGMEVHFSAVISGLLVAKLRFDGWDIGEFDVKAKTGYSPVDVPFEDINHNFTMDKNIDLDLDNFHNIASRGDDKNGDGVMDYDISTWDFFSDFNLNGVCDVNCGEPSYYDNNTGITYFADLNRNGMLDISELVLDHYGDTADGVCDLPPSGDFEHWRWEMRTYFQTLKMPFENNDYAVVIDASAVTKDGVAETALTFPRQFAHRLFVTVNAEINGIRDGDGERFYLPVLVEGR